MRFVPLLLVAGLAGLVLLAAVTSEGRQVEAVRRAEVEMVASYRFDPVVIEIEPGATVTWTNRDHFTHDVHLLGPVQWRSRPVKPGESVSYTFAEPGEYRYQCAFHPQDMQARVVVVAP